MVLEGFAAVMVLVNGLFGAVPRSGVGMLVMNWKKCESTAGISHQLAPRVSFPTAHESVAYYTRFGLESR